LGGSWFEDTIQQDVRRLDFEYVAPVRASELAMASLWTLAGSDAHEAFEQFAVPARAAAVASAARGAIGARRPRTVR
jgi:hypothetical protein